MYLYIRMPAHRITKILISLYNLFSTSLFFLLFFDSPPTASSISYCYCCCCCWYGFWLLLLVFVFACGHQAEDRGLRRRRRSTLWPLCCRCCNCYFTFVHSHANQYNFVTTAQRHGQYSWDCGAVASKEVGE